MSFEKEWCQKKSNEEIADILRNELNISLRLANLLAIRDIKNSKEANDFLYPSLKNILDPKNFIDMEKGAYRIIKAIEDQEKIGIFGDYDVDGVCSAAILYEFLTSLDANVTFTLPNRLLEGYGLSKPGLDRLKQRGASLIVTVDCGITAFEQIEYANNLGQSVIIIDHHMALENLPRAFAIINPKRKDCLSNAEYLCAAGVVFFLCIELRRLLREQNYFLNKIEPDVKDILDLAALATVADVVPLFKDNRIIVKHGLNQIKKLRRLGLKTLLEVASIKEDKISSTNLSFYLGPRINAAGRLEDAEEALNLLLNKDLKECLIKAKNLESMNEERKSLEKNTVEEALELIKREDILKDPVLVVFNKSWHPGVVGIVASRIVEIFYKPAIIIGSGGKGSGRSIPGFDLYERVLKVSHTLKNFGGHAHAIGVSLLDDGVENFRKSLVESIKQILDFSIYKKNIYYDEVLSILDISFDLEEDIKKLEPFGAKNPHPVFRINNSYIRNLRRLEGGHIKGEIESKDGAISFIGFRMDLKDDLVNKPLDFLGIVERNEWQGNISLQFRLIDYKKSF